MTVASDRLFTPRFLLMCGFSFSAELAKILPTGALLKYGIRNYCTVLLFSTGISLERLPVCLKT